MSKNISNMSTISKAELNSFVNEILYLANDNKKFKIKCKIFDLYDSHKPGIDESKEVSKYIKEGAELWMLPSSMGMENIYKILRDNESIEEVHSWHKIRVTYVRSGVFFWDMPGREWFPEQANYLTCFFALSLIPSEIKASDINISSNFIEFYEPEYPELTKIINDL